MYHSTPYYPQANGQAESLNKLVLNLPKKRQETTKGRWIEEPSGTLWAVRTSPKGSINETPFSPVYEIEVIISMEITIPIMSLVLTEDQNTLNRAIDIMLAKEKRNKALR